MLDKGLLDSYNNYILQMGASDEFLEWKNDNIEKYDEFVQWYTTPANYLRIDDKNKFIKE